MGGGGVEGGGENGEEAVPYTRENAATQLDAWETNKLVDKQKHNHIGHLHLAQRGQFIMTFCGGNLS